jgi:hypothetical protein
LRRRSRVLATLILSDPEGKHWPADLKADLPGSECFTPIDLGPYHGAGRGSPREYDRLSDRVPGIDPMSDTYTPKPMEAAPVVLEALDAERARIGREIHDGPAQALTNAIFEVDDIERLIEHDPGNALAGLKQLRPCSGVSSRTSGSSSRNSGRPPSMPQASTMR